MYLYVKLNWDANCFFPVESKDCMNSASYEYRNMSAGKGGQFVPIGMPTICWKTFPPKTTKTLSTRNSSMLMMSSPVYSFFESECSLTKYGPSRPKTRNLYPRFPFLRTKEPRTIVASLLLSLRWGMAAQRVENQRTWCLRYGRNLEIEDAPIIPLNSLGSTSDWPHFPSRMFRSTSEDLA